MLFHGMMEEFTIKIDGLEIEMAKKVAKKKAVKKRAIKKSGETKIPTAIQKRIENNSKKQASLNKSKTKTPKILAKALHDLIKSSERKAKSVHRPSEEFETANWVAILSKEVSKLNKRVATLESLLNKGINKD